MSCSTTIGLIDLDCGNNLGGLQRIYVCPIASVTGITISASTPTNQTIISAITMSGTTKFKEFSFRKGMASLSSESTSDDQAGTFFVTSTVNATFSKMENAKRTELMNIVKQPTYVIAVDSNGSAWFVGYGSQCNSAASAASGAKLGDANMYSINLIAELEEFPIEVKSSVISGIIG